MSIGAKLKFKCVHVTFILFPEVNLHILRFMITQYRIKWNVAENLPHEIVNIFDFVLHVSDGRVPHKMIHNVAREVNCINFLRRKILKVCVTHGDKLMHNENLPNVVL